MTIYEATHNKVYPAKGKFGEDVLVTAEEIIALFLNGNWTYSMHWPEGAGWVEQAKLTLDKIEGAQNGR